MKRGLKVRSGRNFPKRRIRCRDYPDEKGTERVTGWNETAGAVTDAGITPMKRGLKDSGQGLLRNLQRRCRDYPDEKGTERQRGLYH